MQKNYCIVGLGSRGISMYATDLMTTYADVARLTGLCDHNEGRVQLARTYLHTDAPGYTDFDRMLDEVPCDVVIVTTQDSAHDEYIIRAMRRGKDVITEKPMTIDEHRCRAILAAQRETGRDVKVTFNYRYSAFKTEVKRVLATGIVGDIHSVEFRWYLDTVHGADYFRRWHARKGNSGGLLVHKATHHFDLINWWIGSEPIEVAAMGSRQYYTPERYPSHGSRCRTCDSTQGCPFYLDLSRVEEFEQLYRKQESYDGYFRDQCVFSPEIDIEDTMSVLIRYPRAVQVTYALTAATPFEGWQVAFNGSKGRLEAFEPESFVTTEETTDYHRRAEDEVRRTVDWRTAEPGQYSDCQELSIRFYPLFGGVQVMKYPTVSDGHGGGDERLKDDLFREVRSDPLGHVADARAGAMSILVGVAANRSIAENRFVRIDELLSEP
jgi:predicted dehydrogenase